MTVKTLTSYQRNAARFILILLSAISVFWMLSSKNGFCYDDTSWMERVSFATYEELFSFLPQSAYLDRPIGAMFLKLLYDLFGLDSGQHHAVLVLLHMSNVLLIFSLFQRVFVNGGRSEDQAFLGALVTAGFLGIWTRVHMAVQWDAAIFDLLGTFWSLCACWFYLQYRRCKAYRGQNFLLALFFFFLAARTKEMFLTLPVLWLLYELWEMQLDSKWHRPTTVTLIGTAVCLGLLCMLLYHKSQTGSVLINDPTNPYYQSFSLLDMLKTCLKYGSLCFDMETSTWVYSFSYSGALGVGVALLGLGIAVVLALRKNFGLLLCYCAIGVSISTVLPMVNQIHMLYLYFPSIFVGAVIACGVMALSNVKRMYFVAIVLLFGFLLSVQSPANINIKHYWYSIAEMERTVWEDIQKIPAPPARTVIYVRNMDELDYTPFFYSNGGVCRLLYQDPTLSIQLVGPGQLVIPEGQYMIWEYQGSHVREVERSTDCQKSVFDSPRSNDTSFTIDSVYLEPVNNGTIKIGITCSDINESLQILLDGEPCQTTIGETFISTSVERTVAAGDQITLQVLNSALGVESAIYEITLTGETQSLSVVDIPEDGALWRTINAD